MNGTTYAIGEILAFIVGATLIGLIVGWLAGRASRPAIKGSLADFEGRAGRLEHRLATLRKTATAAGIAVPDPKPVVKTTAAVAASKAAAGVAATVVAGAKSAEQAASGKMATPVAVAKDAVTAVMSKGAPEAASKAAEKVAIGKASEPVVVEAGKGKMWRKKEAGAEQKDQNQSDELKDRLAALDTQLADLEQRLATFKQS